MHTTRCERVSRVSCLSSVFVFPVRPGIFERNGCRRFWGSATEVNWNSRAAALIEPFLSHKQPPRECRVEVVAKSTTIRKTPMDLKVPKLVDNLWTEFSALNR